MYEQGERKSRLGKGLVIPQQVLSELLRLSELERSTRMVAATLQLNGEKDERPAR
jgi:hypothetical protein